MAKIITAVIDDQTGDISIDLEGYHGKGCHAVQEVFGRALGATTKSVKKPEYNKPQKNTTCVRQ